jgi:hypothetical protein
MLHRRALELEVHSVYSTLVVVSLDLTEDGIRTPDKVEGPSNCRRVAGGITPRSDFDEGEYSIYTIAQESAP